MNSQLIWTALTIHPELVRRLEGVESTPELSYPTGKLNEAE